MCPKFLSEDTAIQKSFRGIRSAFLRSSAELSFVRYHQSQSVVIKNNKHHRLMAEYERLVVNDDVLYALVNQFSQPNRMEHLHFELCNIKDSGIAILMKANWKNLIELDLCQNRLTAISIEKLIEPRNLNSLKQLRLNANLLDSNASQILVKGQWKELQELALDFNNLGDQGINNLSGHKWIKLKRLHLMKNNIHNEGIKGLIAMKMPHIQELFLGYNLITDAGCKLLARGRWRLLKRLQIEGNIIQDDGLNYLANLACFNLVSLKLFASNIHINIAEEISIAPSMSGFTRLLKGCWNRLKIEISLGKMGPVSIENFMMNKQVKDMMQLRNVVIALSYK